MQVVAEIKRASPSKGDIAIGIVAGEQGLKYARAGTQPSTRSLENPSLQVLEGP